jgi:hypothetical protein
MAASLGPPDETNPFLDQSLPGLVCWMRLSGDYELHGALRIAQ